MLRYLWVVPCVYFLDQLTKFAALKYLVLHEELPLLPFLNLTLVFNTGAAFGFLSGASGWQNLVFILVAIVACVVVLAMLRGLAKYETQVALALVLVLGGALGNLTDRLIYGHVVDFIDFVFGVWHFWAFNVADSAITVGAVLLILDAIGIRFGRRRG